MIEGVTEIQGSPSLSRKQVVVLHAGWLDFDTESLRQVLCKELSNRIGEQVQRQFLGLDDPRGEVGPPQCGDANRPVKFREFL